MIIGGKYEVLEELGRGAMGRVHRVRHLELDTILALKTLPRVSVPDTELIERFRREARVLARLNHPNIVRVTDSGRDGDLYYLVMEYVRGHSLRRHLQEHRRSTGQGLPMPEVIDVGLQIATALAYAHRQSPSIVHRDIKPANVLVEDHTGRVVVTDFGIAKLVEGGQAELTRSGGFLGTVRYSAPEQMRRDPGVDGRADIYSLGMVMYELYTGRGYFGTLTDEEVIVEVLSGEEDLDPELAVTPIGQVVARAIARDRAARFRAAEDLIAALRACRDGGSATADEPLGRTSISRAVRQGRSATATGEDSARGDASQPTAGWSISGESVPDEAASAGNVLAEATPRRVRDTPLQRLRAAGGWLADRWWMLAANTIALLVAAVCIAEALTWIGRPFPGFLVMENAVVPTASAYHWSGMRSGLPFHSRILAIDDVPLRRANDVYAHAETVPVGTRIAYRLEKDGRRFSMQVPTMRFDRTDYALTFGMMHLNGMIILLMGLVVGLLSPRNRPARLFVAMSLAMGLFPLTGTDLYRPHRFTALHFFTQCIAPTTFIHLAFAFPVERAIRGLRRLVIAGLYLFAAALTVLVLRGLWLEPPRLAPLYVSYAYSAAGLLLLVAAPVIAYLRDRRPLVRSRAQVIVIGVVAAFPLGIFGFANNVFGGGDFPINLVALTPLLFFLAVAYAIVNHELFDAGLLVRRGIVLGAQLAGATGLYVLAVSALNAWMTRADVARSPALMGIVMALSLATALPLRHRLSEAIDKRWFPERQRFHRTIRELSATIAGMTDLASAIEEVIRALQGGMHVTGGAVLVHDEASGCLRDAGAFGTCRPGYRLPASTPVVRLLAGTQTELFADDLTEDPELSAIRAACSSVFADLQADLLLPLVTRSGLVGILALGPLRDRRIITSDELKVLRSLAAAIGLAVARSDDVTAVERMILRREALERHLPAGPTDRILEASSPPPRAERAEVTVLCVRLGAVDRAEDEEASAALEVMREFRTLCETVVREHDGTVEGYGGAELVAMFGAPVPLPEHALQAARVSLAIRDGLREHHHAASNEDGRVKLCGGLATGAVQAGFVGGREQETLVGLGPGATIARHLCAAADGAILVSERTAQAIAPAMRLGTLKTCGTDGSELVVAELQGTRAA